MMLTSKVPSEFLTHRLDCPFYHPDAMKLDQKYREYKNIKLLSQVIDSKRHITNGVRGPDIQPSNYHLVRLQDCQNWEINFDECLTISEKQFHENRRCQLFEGDIVVAIGGYVGNASIARNVKPAVIGQHSAVLPFNPNGNFDERYLLAYLNSAIAETQFNRYVSGSIQAGINLEDLRDIPIPIPHKAIQNYIGDKVRLAERLRERSRELEKVIQDKMQNCFCGNPKPYPSKHHRIDSDVLTPNRLEYEFYTPLALWANAEILGSQWKYKKLADIALRIKDGPGGWGVSTSDYVNTGVPVIRAINLIDGECNLTDCIFITQKKHQELSSHKVKPNSVLLSVRGTIGRAAVFESEEYKEANLNAAVVTIDCNNEILPHFLAEFITTEVGIIQSQRMANGAVQLNMNLEETGNNLIIIPPKDFQEKIVNLRQSRLAMKQLTGTLTTTAKLLVEALIEGKITEDELKTAQQALQKGDREPDKAILSRLTRKGIDIKGEPPLFPDLDALYEITDQITKDTEEE